MLDQTSKDKLSKDNAKDGEYRATQATIEALALSSYEIEYEPYGITTSPDFLIKCSEQFYLEIIKSGGGFDLSVLEGQGIVISRSKYDTPGIRDKIAEACKAFLKDKEVLILTIPTSLPLEERGRLAKKIAKEIKSSYDAGKIQYNDYTELIIDLSPICKINILAKLIKNSCPDVLVVPISKSLPEVSSLAAQASYILKTALSDKNKKLSVNERINVDIPLYLVVDNVHPLIEIDMYEEAYNRLALSEPKILGIFKKLFVVFDNRAYELIKKDIDMQDRFVAAYHGDSVWEVPAGSDIEQFGYMPDILNGFQMNKKYDTAAQGFLKKAPEYLEIIKKNKDLPQANSYRLRIEKILEEYQK
jgi:hypothetical protein